ncbi:SNF2 family N-terminal domain-containing protein [Apiospora marii]|uniref:SNF2 family N-terminal domain-containing protein n=1 Tax=Apiospora marii TaxID=335849 RepID=A0ABR1SBZ4_9PEZI
MPVLRTRENHQEVRRGLFGPYLADDHWHWRPRLTAPQSSRLNLTAASRIFIFELQWNPSIERQAIARAIRIGQTRQVRVTRYLIRDTVEQEIHSQQKKKRKAADMGFTQETNQHNTAEGVH